MGTVAETPVFVRYAVQVWSGAERQEFIDFIAANPQAGDFLFVRSRSSTGKRGGARIIYFLAPDGAVWLLIAYANAKFDNLPASFLAQLKKGVEDAI
jgi:hypothetical protein